MTNKELAEANIHRASIIFREAERLDQEKAWNLAVRRCQEAVELALKGALRYAGLDIPRVHDVGGFLLRNAKRFPDVFREKIPYLASVSRKLMREREVSIYGDEVTGITPEELYIEEDAETALKEATSVLETCRKLLSTTL